MNRPRLTNSLRGRHDLHLRALIGPIVLLLLAASCAAQPVRRATGNPDTSAIPIARFSRIIRHFSEQEGSFFSDNFVSNETSYLHIVDKLKQLGVSGGAYIGVGPEQNFTYIAKIRPRIAFIVDIRREAMIQHLMYKAIFRLAPTRAAFLSWLFSKPLGGRHVPGRNATMEQLVSYFSRAPVSEKRFVENLATIRKTIEGDFQFPLSRRDRGLLGHVYGAFKEANLRISFRFGGGLGGSWYGGFPSLKDLLLATDLNGKLGNFLASKKDYNFVRGLQNRNRVIPIVGDFAGKKALAAVADYLRENGYTVSAFYTSNVEQFLFRDEVFNQFVENIQKLPINGHSVFIRSFHAGWRTHPAHVPGHRMTTILQKMSVFLKDYDEGRFPNYWSLVTTDFISGNGP